MKFVSGIAAGVLITVLGQWALQATPDAASAATHVSVAWSWAQDTASDRLWWFVIVLGILALATFTGGVFALYQDDWLTGYAGATLCLIGLAFTAALSAVVTTATAHPDRTATSVLMLVGLVAWIVRRAQVVRRAMA